MLLMEFENALPKRAIIRERGSATGVAVEKSLRLIFFLLLVTRNPRAIGKRQRLDTLTAAKISRQHA